MKIEETADFSPAAKILWEAEGSDLVCHAWHHPRYHAHALREHDRTLGCGFPQRVREVPGRQRQNAGRRHEVCRMRVEDDAAVTARRGGTDTVVHVMARELTGGSRPAFEPQNMHRLAPAGSISTMPIECSGPGSTLREYLPLPVAMKYSPASVPSA